MNHSEKRIIQTNMVLVGGIYTEIIYIAQLLKWNIYTMMGAFTHKNG